MPRVKITETCMIWTSAATNVVYSPADSVLAPDAHVDEIVARGCGERLTGRGQDLPRDNPPAEAADGQAGA